MGQKPGSRTKQEEEDAEDAEDTLDEAGREIVANALRDGYTPESMQTIYRDAVALADGILAAKRHVDGPPPPKACAAGCSYCCSLQVEISVPEVLALVAYVEATFSPAEQEAFKQRLADTARLNKGLNSFQRLFARLPCPLLIDGKCSVYESRPLVCRGYTSPSWLVCAQDFKTSRSWRPIPHEEAEQDIYSNIMMGVAEGLKDQGLPSPQMEMIAALRVAVEEPDAGRRWLAGEPLFDEAITPED